MKSMKASVYFLFLALAITACGPKYEKLESGYLFRKVEAKNGTLPQDSDALKVHMRIKLEDSLIVDSRKLFPVGRRLAMNNMMPTFKEVLKRIGDGDSVEIKMPIAEYSKLEGRTLPLKDSSQVVTISMRVLDVGNEGSIIEKMYEEQFTYEEEQIKSYLINNNLEAERTEEGIYYVISRLGEGKTIDESDTIYSNFTLRLLDGKMLSTNVAEDAKAGDIFRADNIYKPYKFMLSDQLLQGWKISVPYLKKGGKGKFLIPSRYGFGPRSAAGVVPPNATLIYDIEILELK